jgi:hypothetical protein
MIRMIFDGLKDIIIINIILILFSIFPENHKSDGETKLIIGFSLKNRIIYSNIRIILDDYDTIWGILRLISIKLMVIYCQIPKISSPVPSAEATSRACSRFLCAN